MDKENISDAELIKLFDDNPSAVPTFVKDIKTYGYLAFFTPNDQGERVRRILRLSRWCSALGGQTMENLKLFKHELKPLHLFIFAAKRADSDEFFDLFIYNRTDAHPNVMLNDEMLPSKTVTMLHHDDEIKCGSETLFVIAADKRLESKTRFMRSDMSTPPRRPSSVRKDSIQTSFVEPKKSWLIHFTPEVPSKSSKAPKKSLLKSDGGTPSLVNSARGVKFSPFIEVNKMETSKSALYTEMRVSTKPFSTTPKKLFESEDSIEVETPDHSDLNEFDAAKISITPFSSMSSSNTEPISCSTPMVGSKSKPMDNQTLPSVSVIEENIDRTQEDDFPEELEEHSLNSTFEVITEDSSISRVNVPDEEEVEEEEEDTEDEEPASNLKKVSKNSIFDLDPESILHGTDEEGFSEDDEEESDEEEESEEEEMSDEEEEPKKSNFEVEGAYADFKIDLDSIGASWELYSTKATKNVDSEALNDKENQSSNYKAETFMDDSDDFKFDSKSIINSSFKDDEISMAESDDADTSSPQPNDDHSVLHSPILNIAGKFVVKSKSKRESLPICDGQNFIIESNSSDSSMLNCDTPVINTAVVGHMIVTPNENTFDTSTSKPSQYRFDEMAFSDEGDDDYEVSSPSKTPIADYSKPKMIKKHAQQNTPAADYVSNVDGIKKLVKPKTPAADYVSNVDGIKKMVKPKTPTADYVSNVSGIKKLVKPKTPTADYVSNVDGIKKLVKPKTPLADYVSNVCGVKRLTQPATPAGDYVSNVDGGIRKLFQKSGTPKADYVSNVGYVKKIYKPRTPPANYDANLKGFKKMITKAEATSPPKADYIKHVDFAIKKLFHEPKYEADSDDDGLADLFEELGGSTPPPVKRTKKARMDNVATMLATNLLDSPARSTRSQRRLAVLADPPKLVLDYYDEVTEVAPKKKRAAPKKTKKLEDDLVDGEDKIDESVPKKKKAAPKKTKKVEVVKKEDEDGETTEATSKKTVARKRTRKMANATEKSSESAEDCETTEATSKKTIAPKRTRKMTTTTEKSQDSDEDEPPKPTKATRKKRTKKDSEDSLESKTKSKPKVSPRRTRSRRAVNRDDDIDIALNMPSSLEHENSMQLLDILDMVDVGDGGKEKSKSKPKVPKKMKSKVTKPPEDNSDDQPFGEYDKLNPSFIN